MSNGDAQFILGEFKAEIQNLKTAMAAHRESVTEGIRFMAQTTERLRAGSERFRAHQEIVEEHKARIEKQEARVCPSVPKPAKVYAILTLGILFMSAIIAISIAGIK